MDDKLLEILHEFRDQHEMLAYRGAAGEADAEAIAAIKQVFLGLESMQDQKESAISNTPTLRFKQTEAEAFMKKVIDAQDILSRNSLRQAIRKEVEGE